jgi:hypothetical protein
VFLWDSVCGSIVFHHTEVSFEHVNAYHMSVTYTLLMQLQLIHVPISASLPSFWNEHFALSSSFLTVGQIRFSEL